MTPTAPPSTRPFAAVAIAAALLAAVALPGRPLGLGMLLVALALAAAVLAAGAIPRRWFPVLLLVAAVGLAAMAAVRSAGWLLWIDVGAAAALAALAAADARSWAGLRLGLVRFVAMLPAGPPVVARSTGLALRPGTARAVMPLTRGLALGLTLVLVFGLLFASADAAFAELSEQVLTPDVDLGLLPARAGVFIAVVAICGVLMAIARMRRTEAGPTARPASSEWVIALVLVDLVFAVFVVVQLRVLFGGDRHVLETAGLTYAEYARQGFVQLLVVGFLTLAVMAAAARRRGERRGHAPTVVEALLGLLGVLAIVVCVSALRRLDLLESTYGLTVARLLGHAATLWVGAILALVIGAGAFRITALLPRAVLALTAAGLLGLSLANPEGLVARHNVDRFDRTGKIDLHYLAGLGPDAAPALAELPPNYAACALSRIDDRLAGGDGFFARNVGRERARTAISGLARPPTPGLCP